MSLVTTCCTNTSASVLKSCANRLRFASPSLFSCTNMDSSLGLDRQRRAMLAAVSDARSAQPIRPGRAAVAAVPVLQDMLAARSVDMSGRRARREPCAALYYADVTRPRMPLASAAAAQRENQSRPRGGWR